MCLKPKSILFRFIGVLLLILISLSYHLSHKVSTKLAKIRNLYKSHWNKDELEMETTHYLLSKQTCKLPNLQINDPHYAKFFHKSDPIKCSEPNWIRMYGTVTSILGLADT